MVRGTVGEGELLGVSGEQSGRVAEGQSLETDGSGLAEAGEGSNTVHRANSFGACDVTGVDGDVNRD